jgi:hypothetical protein
MTTMTTAQTSNLADVLNTYCKLAIGPTFANSEPEERRVLNFVLNLQREGADNDWIYDCLTELNPLLGCPLAFYQEIFLPYDEASKTCNVNRLYHRRHIDYKRVPREYSP